MVNEFKDTKSACDMKNYPNFMNNWIGAYSFEALNNWFIAVYRYHARIVLLPASNWLMTYTWLYIHFTLSDRQTFIELFFLRVHVYFYLVVDDIFKKIIIIYIKEFRSSNWMHPSFTSYLLK